MNNGFAFEFRGDHLVKVEGIAAKIGKRRALENGEERAFAGPVATPSSNGQGRLLDDNPSQDYDKDRLHSTTDIE